MLEPTDNVAKIRIMRQHANAVSMGKVLDVSDIAPDGTGSRTREYKILNRVHRPMGQVGDLVIVSNNYPAYHFAVMGLGPEYAEHSRVFAETHGKGFVKNLSEYGPFALDELS